MVKVVDETKADLKALIERDFGSLDPSSDFVRLLIDWLHYRTRSIPRRPRIVVTSQDVQAKIASYPAILKIRYELEKGGNMSPWLSDSVRKAVSDPKADMMFNDWQIIHFHLGNMFVQSNKISRTDDLLFAFMTSDRAVLLGVHPHGAWALRDILRVLLKTSPKDMERSELKGVAGLTEHYTDNEILKLRQAGVNAIFEMEGRYFFTPGFGITLSKHATRITRLADKLHLMIESSRKALENNSAPQHLLVEISKSVGVPVKLGIKIAAGQLILYDKNRSLNLMFMPVLE
jgi:hypothetical protein